jgi:hypothetical protein
MRAAFIICAGFWAMLAMVMFSTGAAEPEPCVDTNTRELIRSLMHDGLDAAMRDHTKRMFEGWMKDDTDQPQRAATGMRNGVRGYVGAHAAVENWNPPACKGDRQ